MIYEYEIIFSIINFKFVKFNVSYYNGFKIYQNEFKLIHFINEIIKSKLFSKFNMNFE